jgi:hypothetical protein
MQNKIQKLIFVGGAPRSGTTLVQNILGNHTKIYAGPEFDWMPDFAKIYAGITKSIDNGRLDSFFSKKYFTDQFRTFIYTLFEESIAGTSKSMFSEKTPDNVLYFDTLLTIFPEARFVFIVRDPRAIFNSTLSVFRRASTEGKRIKFGRSYAKSLHRIHKSISKGANFINMYPGRCHLIFYEDLIDYGEIEIKRLCEFLSIEYEEAMTANNPGIVTIVASKGHESALGFNTNAILRGGLVHARKDGWMEELSRIEKGLCNLYFKKRYINVLDRYRF